MAKEEGMGEGGTWLRGSELAAEPGTLLSTGQPQASSQLEAAAPCAGPGG